MNTNQVSLTIGIPTFNRGRKLMRLLRQIEEQATTIKDFPRLQVLVSNNASTDNTNTLLAEFHPTLFDLRIIQQQANIGGCRNSERLHRECITDYMWIFSDDDMLLPGAIRKVWTALRECHPDILRFSFIQPLGDTNRTFTYADAVYNTSDKREIAQIISRNWKISTYVHKCRCVPSDDPIFHYAYGYGWIWLAWSYAVVSMSEHPKLSVISEPLASCDEDENSSGTRFGFFLWSQMPRVFLHPFVQQNAPDLLQFWSDWVYRYWVNASYEVRLGKMPEKFFTHCSDWWSPPFDWRCLRREGRLLMRWLAVRCKGLTMLRICESIEGNPKMLRMCRLLKRLLGGARPQKQATAS